jgi:hypothetical protein
VVAVGPWIVEEGNVWSTGSQAGQGWAAGSQIGQAWETGAEAGNVVA